MKTLLSLIGVKDYIYGAIIIGSLVFVWNMYDNWHNEPLRERDECFKTVSDLNDIITEDKTEIDNMIEVKEKIISDINTSIEEAASKSYKKGLSDCEENNENTGTICFTPKY